MRTPSRQEGRERTLAAENPERLVDGFARVSNLAERIWSLGLLPEEAVS